MAADPAFDIEALLALPEGRRVLSANDFVRAALAHPGTSHVVGVEGCAGPLVARAVAASGRPVLYVTPDLESARHAADDISFVSAELAGAPAQAVESSILLFTPSETSPYAEVHPE